MTLTQRFAIGATLFVATLLILAASVALLLYLLFFVVRVL
jgi:hypothetical protein